MDLASRRKGSAASGRTVRVALASMSIKNVKDVDTH